MGEEISLSVSDWAGSGPWTQTVTLQEPDAVADAVIGLCESSSAAMVTEALQCGLYVSGINGTMLTITALFRKPTIALTLGALVNEERDL